MTFEALINEKKIKHFLKTKYDHKGDKIASDIKISRDTMIEEFGSYQPGIYKDEEYILEILENCEITEKLFFETAGADGQNPIFRHICHSYKPVY